MADLAPVDPGLVEDPYPFQQLLGFRLTHWAEGIARFELQLTDRLMDRYGIPHHGVYASLLDTVMGFCGSYTGDPDRRQLCMTLSLTTNFLGQPSVTLLLGEGRRVCGGRSTSYAEGTLTDETGATVATSVRHLPQPQGRMNGA